MAFQKATKERAFLRLAKIGPPGAGKTFSSLKVARALVGPTGRIALRDSEHGSAAKYADLFEFDTETPGDHSPRSYIESIREAERGGYDVLILDSLSHAWAGKGGALEMVDQAAARDKNSNSFAAWRHVTPEHNSLVEAMLGCQLHLIVTLRVKVEWVVEKDERGKNVPRKVGLAPIQRDGLEYEFDVVGDLDDENRYVITKTRCRALHRAVIIQPGEELALTLRGWLSSGATPRPRTSQEQVVVGPQKVKKPILELTDTELEGALAYYKNATQNPDALALEAKKQPPAWLGPARSRLQGLMAEQTWRQASAVSRLEDPFAGNPADGASGAVKEPPTTSSATTSPPAPAQSVQASAPPAAGRTAQTTEQGQGRGGRSGRGNDARRSSTQSAPSTTTAARVDAPPAKREDDIPF